MRRLGRDVLDALTEVRRAASRRISHRQGRNASPARDVAEVVEERMALPEAPVTPAVMDRALQVAGLLAGAGALRGAKPADLVIAAAAEAAGLVVLHYDDDYDRIASVTNQPTEWVVRKGTLPH